VVSLAGERATSQAWLARIGAGDGFRCLGCLFASAVDVDTFVKLYGALVLTKSEGCRPLREPQPVQG
jgi:hypothetical protein